MVVAVDEPTERELRVMPWWLVLVGLLAAVALGWLVLDLLLTEADRASQPDTRATLRIDAIRTGLTVVAGTGGGLALLLAARRQWIAERAQRHQESVAARDQVHRDRVQAHAETVAEAAQRHQDRQSGAAEHDAAERRLTELYTRAVELLGNDSAAVRLGGLHALERLGQDNPGQRPTIAAVLCAYLRMPAPDGEPRETEVRRSAQRVLTRHLRADDAAHWPELGSTWPAPRLSTSTPPAARSSTRPSPARCSPVRPPSRARRRGGDSCSGRRPSTTWSSRGSRPTARSCWMALRVGGQASFDDAAFRRRPVLSASQLHRPDLISPGDLRSADQLRRDPLRGRRHVSGGRLRRRPVDGAHRVRPVGSFHSVRFTNMALFRWTVFGAEALFDRARFVDAANFGRARFHSMASFRDTQFSRPPQVEQARAKADPGHRWPAGTTVARLDDEWLLLVDR